MAKINLKLKDEDRDAWVEAAWNERVSLSEWIRRACNERLGRPLINRTAEHPLTDQQIQEATAGVMLLAEQAALTAGATTAEDVGATDGTPPDAKGGGTTVAPAAEQSRPSPAASAERQFTPDFKPEPKPKTPRR